MTDTEPFVLQQAQSDGVVLLTLNRGPMNPLSSEMLAAITDAACGLAQDQNLKAVVVTGGPKAFAAGADVKQFAPNEASALRVAASFRAASDALASIYRPVIAAISGYALGGGIELAMACDYRIAADSARIGQPEILLGIIPGGGGTQRLARLVGPSRAKELIWSGRQIRSEEALSIGLVDEVVPADELLAHALAVASKLSTGAVAAMGLAKRAIDGGLDIALSDALDLEATCFAMSFETQDAATGIASFNEHGPGKAQFSGR